MRTFSLVFAVFLVGCQQQPYRVFAVQVEAAKPVAVALPAGTVPVPRARAAAGGDGLGEFTALHPQWDLNTASAQTLAQLPGIEAATVQAIIAGRPYKDKRELVRREILTQKQYDTWKSYLVVHRSAVTAAAH